MCFYQKNSQDKTNVMDNPLMSVVMFILSLILLFAPFLSRVKAAPDINSSRWFSPARVKSKALLVGYNARKKRMLYVCGSYLWGSFQLGLNYNYGDSCHVSFRKRIYTVDTFYLLKELSGRWQNVMKTHLPKNTLFLGVGLGHAPLALCRSYINGSIIPGKTWPGLRGCQISYRGKVEVVKEYAVFVSTPSASKAAN